MATSNSASSDSTKQLENSTSQASSNNTEINTKTTTPIALYDVEHLATFSSGSGQHEAKGEREGESRIKSGANIGGEPKVALQRLFELEKLSGVWTQRMQIELRGNFMLIVDCETNSVVEKFAKNCVVKPEAFSQYNDIYNNIVVFTIQQEENSSSAQKDDEQEEADSQGKGDVSERADEKSQSSELHIFQCVSHDAQQLVADIQAWKINLLPEEDEEVVSSPKAAADELSSATKFNKSNAVTNSPSQNQKQPQAQTETTSTDKSNKSSDHMSGKRSLSSQATNGSAPATKPVVVTVASSTSTNENVPIVNVNVKETVQVFNQIAALREKSKPTSPISGANRPLSDASAGSSAQSVPAPTDNPSQLYKQRSIRATLAPNFLADESQQQAAGASGKSLQDQTQRSQAAGSSSSASTSSSSAVSEATKAAPHNQLANSAQSNSHHEAGSSSSSGGGKPKAASSSVSHQASSNSGGSGHHKSSKSQPRSHNNHHNQPQQQQQHQQQQQQQQQRTQSDSSHSHASSSSAGQIADQVTTNESYVSVLNHCFDDIEKFIIRIQQAATAYRELQAKKKLSKRSSNQMLANQAGMLGIGGKNGVAGQAMAPPPPPAITASELAMLSARARGPSEEDYFDILSKFKLAFNLLAKLKGCIHEPNAPELVHFLFTPLAIIIDSARNVSPPIDPTIVSIPYLNQDALDLLSNCCTSKESDMWLSLGPEWTQTIDPIVLTASRLPTSFQPIFSDGWAPVISELELIGLAAPDRPNLAGASEGHHRGSSHYESSSAAVRRHSSYAYDEPPAVAGFPAPGAPSDYSSQSHANSNHHNGNGSSKLHSAGRAHRKSRVSPSPPRGIDLAEPAPYFGRDYAHNPGIEALDYESAGGYRVPMQAAGGDPRNGHYRRPELLLAGRHKGAGSRRPPPPDDYQAPQFPLSPLHPVGGPMEYSRYPNAHSDDYVELPDHHVDDLRRYKAGPSAHRRKSHSTRYSQPSVWQPDQHDIYGSHPIPLPFDADSMSELEREAMLLDLGPAQTEWFFELQSRAAMIVRVLFTREANNDKELTVRRGEILEVLDDSRKWWRARNINLEIAHVPHTIVAVMHGYQTIDELLTQNPSSLPASDDPSFMQPQGMPRRDLQAAHYMKHPYDDRRNSKAAGAFRYF